MNHLQLQQAALPDLSESQISRLPKDQLAHFSNAVQQWMPAGVVLLGHRELDLHEVLYAVTCNDHPLGDLGQVLLIPDDFFRMRDIDLQVTVVDTKPGRFGLAKGCGMTDLDGIAGFHAPIDPTTHLQGPFMELLHRVAEMSQLVFGQTADLAL